MKKKILIVIPGFSIGGTIVSLHSLLSILDTSRYEVSLFALSRSGVYLNKMPNCTILDENIWLSYRYHGSNVFKKLFVGALRIIRIGLSKIGINIVPILARIGSNQIKTMQYNAIVSYSESINSIVCHYRAKKRIAWIHCEYSRMLKLYGITSEKRTYQQYDNIVCVSQFAKHDFCSHYPEFEHKVSVVYNVIDVDRIRSLANEKIDWDLRYDNDCFTIVSVGRLDPVKQFDKIPQIASQVKQLSPKPFKWFIIGGEREVETLEKDIKKSICSYDLEENVILLGEKTNVYPYMARANLYVCLSSSEAFPLVVNEAETLGLPVVSNRFGAVYESVEDKVDGYVVELQEMPTTIAGLMNRDTDYKRIRENVRNKRRDNLSIMNTVYDIWGKN